MNFRVKKIWFIEELVSKADIESILYWKYVGKGIVWNMLYLFEKWLIIGLYGF